LTPVEAAVLHSLYGVGTDITVTKTPTAGSNSNGFGFGFRQQVGTQARPKTGSTINNNTLSAGGTLAAIKSSAVTSVAKLTNVAAAAGGLTLSDRTVTGKVPAFNINNTPGGSGGTASGSGGSGGGPGSFGANFKINSFNVSGVDIANGELGPLSTGKISSGRTFTSADSATDVALIDSAYATQQKLKVGGTIGIGDSKNVSHSFKIVGIVTEPAGANPADVYIPLGVAQSLANMKNQVNTIYVAANSGQNISSVASSISKAVPGSTVTDASTLASQVTGSIASAASLANNLGKWLAIAVLVAAFGLASLLTMSAVSRRIREFGTLKALGWKSRRVILQVMGESIVIGIIGGAVGVALGFVGAAMVGKFAAPLTATVGTTTGNATPGGAQFFNGGGAAPPSGGAFPGGSTGTGTNPFRGAFSNAAQAADTVTAHLSAPVTISVIIAAVGLAVLGGLIAGTFGGWRAARLRPAAALSKVA
jgi:ABC-type lipoprotein release transport system permease subunit